MAGPWRRRLRLHGRPPARLRRRPGLHRRSGRRPQRRQLRAPALAARLADRRAGGGPRDEDVPRRLPRRTTSTRPPRWSTGSTTTAGRRSVLPRLADLAGGARSCSASPGLALDQELYGQTGGARPRPGTGITRATPTPRRRCGRRPRDARRAGDGARCSTAFPEVELAVYHVALPRRLERARRAGGQRRRRTLDDLLHIDFWDGMTSVDGLRGDPLLGRHLLQDPAPSGTWDTALTYNTNQIFATFSRGSSNWDVRLRAGPPIAVQPGSTPARTPRATSTTPGRRTTSRSSCSRFAKWGTGGEFANYVYGALDPVRLRAVRGRHAGRELAGEVDETEPPR